MSRKQTTPESAETEVVNLEAPPAPPTGFVGEEADEDGAGNAAPAPSSPDAEEDDDRSLAPETGSTSSPATTEGTPGPHDSSPGFGTTAKFTTARARLAELRERDR